MKTLADDVTTSGAPILVPFWLIILIVAICVLVAYILYRRRR